MDVQLSKEHIAAVNRRRRVVVQFDAIHGDPNFPDTASEDLAKLSLTFADDEGNHIDSIWWNWTEGYLSGYPSKVMPTYDHPGFRKWIADGVDVARVFLDATHARGLEAFYSFRVNGGNNDAGPVPNRIPLMEQHPDWLMAPPWEPDNKHLLNMAIPQVREYKLSVLREAAENYNYDGIEVDFARGPITLPLGHQWENRQALTDFMREVRRMTLDVAARRGRPMLLAVRLPEYIEGCRIDGIDIETWVRKSLVDIIVLGCRSFEADVVAYRQLTAGAHIKLLAGSDEHHTSEGYSWPPIAVLHGVFANWWQQGVDGIYCFNWTYTTAENAERIGHLLHDHLMAPVHRELYGQIGDPAALRYKDKTFVVQRRGGGGSGAPNAVGWETPRFFQNTNMFAQLPVDMDNTGKADTHLRLWVADDLAAEAEKVEGVTLRLILHDAAAGEHIEVIDAEAKKPAPPDEERIERALIAHFRLINHLFNCPPVRGIEKRIELRINNVVLGQPSIEDGVLVFNNIDPNLFAVGRNLLSVRVAGRAPDAPAPLAIERLELDVRYR